MDKNNREFLVIKDNMLVENGGWNFGIAEQKIICLAIAKLKPTDDITKRILISKDEFCKILGIEERGFIKTFNITSKKILKNLCYGEIGNYIGYINFFSECLYNKDTGNIEIVFHSKLKKHLIGLTKNFTEYELINVLALNSKYSIRLYEFLLANEYKHTITLSIDKLKEILVCENNSLYVQFKEFKRRILEPCKKEIKFKTNIKFDYTPIKRGRSYQEIEFNIQKQNREVIKKSINNLLDSKNKVTKDNSIKFK